MGVEGSMQKIFHPKKALHEVTQLTGAGVNLERNREPDHHIERGIRVNVEVRKERYPCPHFRADLIVIGEWLLRVDRHYKAPTGWFRRFVQNLSGQPIPAQRAKALDDGSAVSLVLVITGP